jgi:hypothetical protein
MSCYALSGQDYRAGWIYTVQTEYVLACEFLDEEHPALTVALIHDDNAHMFGRIGDHNVVIACLPGTLRPHIYGFRREKHATYLPYSIWRDGGYGG